jgi:hypothetical protein
VVGWVYSWLKEGSTAKEEGMFCNRKQNRLKIIPSL